MVSIVEVFTESPQDTFERGRNWADSILPGDGSGSQNDSNDNTTPNDGSDIGDNAREFGIGIATVLALLSIMALAFGQLFDIEV